MRRFRVDRISAAELVGPHGQVAHSLPDGPSDAGPTDGGGPDHVAPGPPGEVASVPGEFDAFVPGPDNRRVRLSLDPSAAWLVESIPSAGPLTEVDGRIELEVFVGGNAWLERLLLRLGPEARVVDPPEYRTLSQDAAARILARYAPERASSV